MTDIAFLSSHSIELRPPLDSDVLDGNWSNWYNDPVTTLCNSHGVFPVTRQQELVYIHEQLKCNDSILLAIVEKGSKRLIGNAGLQHIDLINRKCEIAITIGEDAPMSTGVEAFGLLAGHAFDRLNLNRVSGATHEKLTVFTQLISVLGFQMEGRWRQYYLRNREWSDVVLFSLLASDYSRLLKERNNQFLFSTHAELLAAIKESITVANKAV